MRAALIGAGSLGSIIGALMTQGGRPIDLIDANAEHVAALNRDGARITGELELVVPVTALTPQEMSGHYDLVFLLNKQTANDAVLEHLLPFLHSESVVCTLQNGIPEPRVASYVSAARTIGGAVGFGATWIGPGVSQLTTKVETMRDFAFEIGEIDGEPRPRLAQVQDYLSCVGTTRILPDLMGIRWSKVLMNATFSGMSAALGCTFGEVLDDPRAVRCVALTSQACTAISRRMPVFLRARFDGGADRQKSVLLVAVFHEAAGRHVKVPPVQRQRIVFQPRGDILHAPQILQ